MIGQILASERCFAGRNHRGATISSFVSATAGRSAPNDVARTTSGMLNGPQSAANSIVELPGRLGGAQDHALGSHAVDVRRHDQFELYRQGCDGSRVMLNWIGVLPSGWARIDSRSLASVNKPEETRITICSFCSSVLKLTRCWLPSKSWSVPTAINTVRLVRPSSIQGGKKIGVVELVGAGWRRDVGPVTPCK